MLEAVLRGYALIMSFTTASIMVQERLSNLVILLIEHKIATKMDYILQSSKNMLPKKSYVSYMCTYI